MVLYTDLIIKLHEYSNSQTSKGKVISGVVNKAKKYEKPVIAFCGSASEECEHLGLERIVALKYTNISDHSERNNGGINKFNVV